MTPNEIGGANTATAHQTVAPSSPRVCRAVRDENGSNLAPAGKPAGALLGKSEWWTPRRLELAKRLYATDPRRGHVLLAEVNAVDADLKAPVPNWSAYRSRMTFERVTRHAEATAVANHDRIIPADDPLVLQMAAHAAEGLAIQQIAARMGLTFGKVQRVMRRHGIVKTKASRDTTRHDEIRRLVGEGKTAEQIADDMGVHERTARKWMRQAGVAPRQTGRPLGRKTVTKLMNWNYAKPTPPSPVVGPPETVEQFLARGGTVTRCPIAAVHPTQATIPAEDLAQIRAYHAARPDPGNWKAQRNALFARGR